MRHPLEAIAASRRRVVFGALVATTLALMAVLLSVDREFPPGIVAFELVRDGDRAAAMVAGWDATARTWVGFSLGLDYVYLCAYSTTIGLACIMLGSSLRDRGALGIAALAAPVAWMQWLAAGFDAFENATLLHTLTSGEQPRFATASWALASAKFALVALGLAYVVISCGMLLLHRRLAR
jgi:hypothetical protein